MFRTVASVAFAGLFLTASSSGQQPSIPQSQAQLAIRDGRPAEAIALLQPSIDDNTADPVSRLVFIVALIADNRVDAADTEITRLETSGSATPAQLTALKNSVGRIKSAKATAAEIALFIDRGDVRGVITKLDASATNDPGSVFARSYVRRLLGDFAGASDILSRAVQSSSTSTADGFARGLAAVKEQQASFQKAKETFERQVLMNFLSAPKAGCAAVDANGSFRVDTPAYHDCQRQYIESTSRAGQTLFDLAPFSREAISARLTQAIWLGKEAEALDIIRRARPTHSAITVPSYVQTETGDSKSGLLVVDLDTRTVEWIDPPASGTYQHRNPKSKIPADRTVMPFSMVSDFSQDVEVFQGQRQFVKKSIGFKTRGVPWGGVAQADDFLDVFGEIPLRLATRTYGKVIAELLSVPVKKYSLADEKPKRGGLFTGLAYMAVAGMAASQGNTSVASQASQTASNSLVNRSEAMERDAAAKQNWELEMSSVKLAVDTRVIQSEIAALLDGSLLRVPNIAP